MEEQNDRFMACVIQKAMEEVSLVENYMGEGARSTQESLHRGRSNQPITKNIVVVNSVMVQYEAVKSAMVSLTWASEVKDSVVNHVVAKYVDVKSARVEDMSGVPLNLIRDSVTGDSSEYINREEVLSEPGMRLEVFPPAQRKKKYEVAEQKRVVKYIVKIRRKDKMVKLGRRCQVSCMMQKSRIFKLCPRGVLDGSKCHQIVFQFCDNLYFPLKMFLCPVSDLISNPRDQMLVRFRETVF
jgi:hypothetical protein